MTFVALPLFKLELSYLVRHGRRWTALEHLLLWAVAEDARSLADLCRGTAMPERLVVEALVNLVRVGWIELTTLERGGVTTAVLFTANRRGRSVVSMEELPYAFDLEKRFGALHVDRLTATALKEDQLQIRHVDQIDATSTFLLKPEYDKYDASPNRFFDNLNIRPDDHFERPLSHRISSAAQFALLEVIGEHISGLPDDAPAQLHEVILRRMPSHHWNNSESPAPNAQRTGRPLTAREGFGPVTLDSSDILLGGRDHRNEIKRVLRCAKSVVYIHSTFMGGIIETLVPEFLDAAARDVDIVLLWGERRDPLREEPNQSEIKGRLAYSKIPPDFRERIRLGKDPTGSHAKILLADSGPNGSFEAVVGSCNWLSCDYMGFEISVRLKDARLVREIAGMLADLSRPPSGAWGRDVTTLLKIQDRCRRNAYETANKANTAGAMLILNDEHYAAVRDARNASPRCVYVGCDLFGVAGMTTVFEPLRMAAQEDKTSVCILYNRPTEMFVSELDEAIVQLSDAQIAIHRCPNLHGKFMAWDDETLIVTSFNWLAASTGPAHLLVGELGVLVRDRSLVESFLYRLTTAMGIPIDQGAPRIDGLAPEVARD